MSNRDKLTDDLRDLTDMAERAGANHAMGEVHKLVRSMVGLEEWHRNWYGPLEKLREQLTTKP